MGKKKGVVGHDFDGDGKIESNEKQFAKLFDMNDDGMLNKEELKRAKLAWKLARDEFGAQTAYADEIIIMRWMIMMMMIVTMMVIIMMMRMHMRMIIMIVMMMRRDNIIMTVRKKI